jgi:hypothetical protein
VFNHTLALDAMAILSTPGRIMIRSGWACTCPAPSDYLFFPEAQVPPRMPPEYYPNRAGRGAIRDDRRAKKRFDVPIILIGYVTPELGEQMLAEGKADFIGMNRPLIADADLPNKLEAGRPEDIALCTRCGTCLDQSESFLATAASTRRWVRLRVLQGDTKKRVVVVGTAAGMEPPGWRRFAAMTSPWWRRPRLWGLLRPSLIRVGWRPADWSLPRGQVKKARQVVLSKEAPRFKAWRCCHLCRRRADFPVEERQSKVVTTPSCTSG